MLKKNLLFFLFLIFLSNSGYTQIEFQKSFGGLKKESFSHIIPAIDSGYIAVGNSDSYGLGKKDILILKTDNLGNPIWSKVLGGKEIDFATAIDKTQDGNYFITGHSASFGNQYTDIFLIKLSPKGAIIWSKNYSLNNSEFANSVLANNDGGCIILGETIKYLGKGKDADILVLKISPSGELVWSKKYGGKDLDYGYSISGTKDEGYVIGGETKSYTSGEQDMYLLKISSEGKLEWAKAYGGKNSDFGKAAIQTSDEGYLLTGSTLNFNSRDIDILMVKVAKNGITLWSKIYGGNNQEYISALKILKNDEIVVCGYTNSFELPNENAFVQMFTASGMPKWGKAYGSDSTDFSYGMSIINDKEIIACGTTKGFGVQSEDGYIIKTYTKHTLEDCNITDITTLVTKNVSVIETSGGEESEVNMRAIDISPKIIDVVLETKTLCEPEVDY